jgi:hypothetical protein
VQTRDEQVECFKEYVKGHFETGTGRVLRTPATLLKGSVPVSDVPSADCLGPEPDQFHCDHDSNMQYPDDQLSDEHQDPHLCCTKMAAQYKVLPMPMLVGGAPSASNLVGGRGDSAALLADGLSNRRSLLLTA